MRAPGANFITDKNKETNSPIWLYRVALDSEVANDIFFAEYHEDVSYFKDVNTAQTYTAFPIKHGGISSNTENQIDSLKVSVANVDQTIQTYLEAYDGLLGNKVTIRQVFAAHLTDASAYIEDVYYVDSTKANVDVVEFALTSGFDILQLQVPHRKFHRTRCQWCYKGIACWLIDGDSYKAPTGFVTGDPDTCDKTQTACTRHGNLARWGGSPGVPSSRVYH